MWKLKVLAQFVLSKIPFGEDVNYWLQKRLNSYSDEKFRERIIDIVKTVNAIRPHKNLDNITVVEIGTGWDAICPIILYLMGVGVCHTYDHVKHVRYELVKILLYSLESILADISTLSSVPLDVLERRFFSLKTASSLDDLFLVANIIYHAPGDASKTGLPVESVDMVYSHAVLEHVSEKGIVEITRESRRILKKTGVAYHLIGLHDHYAGFDDKVSKVNFLKYPEWLWSLFVKNNISFHNRLREKQFMAIFKNCGAAIIWLENQTDPVDLVRLRTMKVDSVFQGMSHEELAVYRTELLLRFE